MAAGAKDEAKRTAIENKVSVTPGVNDATTRTLLRLHPDRKALQKLAKANGLAVPALGDENVALPEAVEQLLEASYRQQVDLYSIDELAETLRLEAVKLLTDQPGRRFRLKAIGGGGGKGQRIFDAAAQVPTLVREVLAEVKATGVGDNKNILLELNIEQTRHNEIQILGNGRWCIPLGGRDCSLQMHEQKLVEVSVTREGLADAIAEARAAKHTKKVQALESDLAILGRMETEAERFGLAVGLDSASTFECIVDGDRHYFMEVNTRIQVEHRVSELCYGLRFTNPDDHEDGFIVESLVEAMALIARHKTRLPKPARVLRERAAIEARLNATDRALNPAAGGVIVSWSDPIDGEIRDDQGICIKNPDTDLFMRYRLAGAYDSNVALLLATGASRRESWERLVEIFRRTTLRGIDLATNLEFHYGILTWFAARDVWAKPTTKFVVPYLTLVGQLAQEAQSLDLDYAFHRIARAATSGASADTVEATRRVLDLKETLLERPMQRLVEEPHYLSAWLSHNHRHFTIEDERVVWLRNPVRVLADTYRLLHLDTPTAAAAHRIWDHDGDQLKTALAFYDKLDKLAGDVSWSELDEALAAEKPSFGLDASTWARVRAAHAGHQLGVDILSLLPMIADKVGFYDLKLEDDLTITIPERLHDAKLQEAMRKVLVPPPVTKSDEIVAAMGGTFYAQEAPTLPAFVTKGGHFDKGQPLYIIEVMKMFNKVHAPFAGTVTDVLMPTSGVVVRKGQPLFKITPDEIVVEEDPKEKAKRIQANTEDYVRRLL
jgi:acetyl/propionyl-CoA carboxylase alpha subunit